ncbi:prostate and testis expressed 3 [Phyllostomus discolor]|uniref:Prostate and testis expressed 3 n=1 Tax=Phyllostomus discolor TaxID=89673 RepID=A0A833YXH2_9CHIR|nr:prostate and testis expressed 3 [Phyllostomus discolor]
MDRHVLLVLFLFCCFAAGTALKCITCHLQLTSDRCRSGFGVCVAKEEEKCMTLKVYNFGQKHLLSYMVCQRFCKAMKFLYHGRYFVYECCDQNYCNFKVGANLTSELIVDTLIVPRSYKGNLLICGGPSDAAGSG